MAAAKAPALVIAMGGKPRGGGEGEDSDEEMNKQVDLSAMRAFLDAIASDDEEKALAAFSSLPCPATLGGMKE